MARSEATRPSIWNFSDGLPRPLRRPRNDKQLSSLAGARSVLLASRMAIQLDCFVVSPSGTSRNDRIGLLIDPNLFIRVWLCRCHTALPFQH